jgi:spermidine synthase
VAGASVDGGGPIAPEWMMSRALRSALVYLMFGVSGATGLAYEVLWMRQFLPFFGGTSLAAAATLAAFFLGSTAGSLSLGARSRAWPRPLFAFGALEIAVGLTALCVRPILDLYRPASAGLYDALSTHPLAFALVKLAVAFVAIGAPTFFMGGTLPVLGEAMAASRRHLGFPVGGLYAINLLGAAVGALAVPSLLLPSLGLRGAYLCAVAGSLTVGAAACVLGLLDPPRTARAAIPGQAADAGARLASQPLVLAWAAWSGVATLGLEVLWMRMLSLVHENSVYSFALVSVVFLLGLAGGAAVAREALRRGAAPRRVLGWAWSAAGVAILASPRVFFELTHRLEPFSAGVSSSVSGPLPRIAALALLPGCLGLGMALPLLMELAGGADGPAGPVLGRLVAFNTAGAIAGPLLVTFFVAPRLGLWNSIAVVGGLTVVVASGVVAERRPRVVSWIALVASLFLAWPGALPPARIRTGRGETLVSAREGSYGTTAVLEDPHDRWITVNNSYVLGGAAAAGEQRFQGHLPLLLHPAPRRVAFLGLGTGITAAAALKHPVEQIVALEIVPEVVAAARADFGDLNGHLISDRRVEVVADDGRSPDAFDVIVGDLLVPWRPTESALYTREHFESARRALRGGGIFCQWLPLYQLSAPQLAILIRTFVDVFPSATVWRGNFLPREPTLALVGQRDEGAMDVAAIDARIQALAPTLDASTPFLKHPAGVWLSLIGAPAAGDPFLASARLNRDDEPWVELLSSRREETMVGAPLAAVLEALSRDSLEGTPLAGLDATHLAWRQRGMALAHASLVPGDEGERQVLTILRALPEELQRALGVP